MLKMLKWQMFGRAEIEPLRQQFLLAASCLGVYRKRECDLLFSTQSWLLWHPVSSALLSLNRYILLNHHQKLPRPGDCHSIREKTTLS